MKRTRKHIQITLITLAVTTIVALAVAGISSSANTSVEPAQSSLPASFAVSPALPSATHSLPIEPALTDLARQIHPCPDFSGTKLPGQTLNVSLSLPPGLNGTGQCGAAGRTVRPGPFGRPTRPFPIGRTATGEPVARRLPPGGVTTSVGTVTRPGGPRPAVTTGTEIPCELLPGGCPPPIDVGGGGTTGAPPTQLAITGVNVKWGVFESVNGRRGRELVLGKDYASPSQGFSTSFVMAPLHFAELTSSAPPTNPLMIVATVTVEAEKTILSVPPSTSDVSSEPVPIEVPLSLSALEVPKVFVLFLDTDFGGAAAIYLKRNSTLTEQLLKDNVQRLADTYNPLASRLNFVTWFGTYLAGLQTLQHTFALPHWDLKELKNQESNLNDDDFIHRSPYTSVNDTEVEDEASSLLLIGLPDTSMQFFQDRGYSGMHFTAKTGTEMAVLIRNLVRVTDTQPANRVTETTYTSSKTPNNSLSSFKWLN